MYMQDGAEGALSTIERIESWEMLADIQDKKEFKDAKDDAIWKFYEGDISWDAAKALALLWAEQYVMGEYDDHPCMTVAEYLKLDWVDCYAILNQRANWKRQVEFNEKWGH